MVTMEHDLVTCYKILHNLVNIDCVNFYQRSTLSYTGRNVMKLNIPRIISARVSDVFTRKSMLEVEPGGQLAVRPPEMLMVCRGVSQWIHTDLPTKSALQTRHGTRSHFVTQRPSDPEIQRPGDPVDTVTLFYSELQMSTYVADKRSQWARGLPVFIAVWRLHASGK